jgi:hypothetical protein
MSNLSEKIVDKIKTYIFIFLDLFPENRAVYDNMWKNIVRPVRPQITI